MSTYVISDLHGQYEYFLGMLSLIQFSNEDELYILGDVVDRGNGSIKILEYIRKNRNITLLRGNHEDMFLNYLVDSGEEQSVMKRLWVKNGGAETLAELKDKDIEYVYDLAKYLDTLPYYMVVGQFILAHAGIYVDNNDNTLGMSLSNSTDEHFLWSREFVCSDNKIEGYTVICGHTPVQEFGTNKIYKRDGVIVIDCGCGSGHKPGCLRLEDLKEFYL